MPTSIPLTFRAAPFPAGYKADPETLKNDIVARLYAESTEAIAFFASGSIAPSSNVGPWLKNGQEWYVWDSISASYIPQIISDASLGYIASQVAPDPTIYTFWIELNVSNKALAIKYYSGGAWKDVYEDKFALYPTTVEMTAAIAAAIGGSGYAPTANPAFTGVPTAPTAAPGTNTTQISTTAFVTAAIAAIPAPSAFQAYPAQGKNAGAQAITPNGTPVKAVIDTAVVNPAPAPFNTANSRYIAPANGVYGFQISTQIDNDTAAGATMEVSCDLYKNGSSTGIGDLDGTPSPNGARWSPAVGSIIQLATNDYLEVYIDADDTVGTGNINLNKVFLSVWRISE